jgi:hypothetical protein
MCFLKYRASGSVWIKNSHRSSSGTFGICNFTFPCLRQKEGPSSGNRLAFQYHRVSLCAVQNAPFANCGKPCHTDELHLFCFSTLHGLYTTSMKRNEMMSTNYILLCYCDLQTNGYPFGYLYHYIAYHHQPNLSFGSWRSSIDQAPHMN